LPSTRPFHGLGRVGSGGAYRRPIEEAVVVAAIARKLEEEVHGEN